MQELKTEGTIEKLKDMIIDFGDGLLEFETKDVNVLLNQLILQENYNDMLVTELEDLKAEKEKMKEALFKRNQIIQDLDQEIQGLDKDIEELNDKVESLEHDVHLTLGQYNAIKVKYNECVKNSVM